MLRFLICPEKFSLYFIIGSLLFLSFNEITCEDKVFEVKGVSLPQDGKTIRQRLDGYPNPSRNFNVADMMNPKNIPLHNSVNKECPYSPSDAKELLNSLDRVVSIFYESNYQDINTTKGSIGLGILKSQLNYILGEKEAKLTPAVKVVLEKLHASSGRLAISIMNQVIERASNPSLNYGAQVIRNHSKATVAGMNSWNDFDTITKHFEEFKEIGDEIEVAYPELNFQCLVVLIENCNVPHVCKKILLKEIYSQSMLTYQVKYQQFAAKKSCDGENKDAFGDAQIFRDRLCSKAYLEAQFLEKNNFPAIFADLFAEQVTYCGLLGYPNFMRGDWLRHILSRQSKSDHGCFLDVYEGGKTLDSKITVVSASEGKGNQTEEESCLVNLSSISTGALAINLRYLIDSCSTEVFSDIHAN